MKDSWHNNLIGKRLNERSDWHDFGLCDIDGASLKVYLSNKRFIIYESKYRMENLSQSQKRILDTLDEAIDWKKFDELSGVFIIRIVDIDEELEWFDLQGKLIRTTTLDELYEIFSAKDKV